MKFRLWENNQKIGPDELQSSRDLLSPLKTHSEVTGGVYEVHTNDGTVARTDDGTVTVAEGGDGGGGLTSSNGRDGKLIIPA